MGAKVILFVIDINTTNYSALDKINNLLQKNIKQSQKVITVFNKCESFQKFELNSNLYKYIYDAEHYVSSIHKIGTDHLLKTISKILQATETQIKQVTSPLPLLENLILANQHYLINC